MMMTTGAAFQDPATGCTFVACLLQVPPVPPQPQWQPAQRGLPVPPQLQWQSVRGGLPVPGLVNTACLPMPAGGQHTSQWAPAATATVATSRTATANTEEAPAALPAAARSARRKRAAVRPTVATANFGVLEAGVARESPSAASPGGQSLEGSVWHLARDAQGCRRVQEALEDAASDEAREALAAELRGHVWQAVRHPHANHVLQKCIMTMRPAAVQFIIDELTEKGPEGSVKAARHAYGCRILQRLLEHCRPDQLVGLVAALMPEAAPLAKHIYGKFVIQHMLECGTNLQQRQLMSELEMHIHELGHDIHSGAVLSKALSVGDPQDQDALARALVRQPGTLAALAATRYGSAAARLVLEMAQGPEREEAQRQVSEKAAALSTRRYGRAVVACLDSKKA